MRGSVAVPILLLIAIAAAGLSMAAMKAQRGASQVAEGTYQNITPKQLNLMLRKKDFLLVNVHVPYEGEIPGTDVFVPYNEVQKRASMFPTDRQAQIVVYCMTGRMSAIAAEALVRMGYTNVLNLDGGMVAWEKEGYPLRRR